MRIALAVLLLFIAYAASYPSLRDITADDEENNNGLELKLRSLLNELEDEQDSNEQMERSVSSDEDDDEDSSFSKRQVKKETKCEIECVHKERFPSRGKGKTIKEAAKTCKNKCVIPGKKHGGKHVAPKKPGHKMGLRELLDNDSNSSEEQQNDRREFYDYLMEQIQRNNKE
ncbi:unnamed protein product [Adineta steineri]|uniref:Uncharacterized protein n=1 Tax=Adineta steineri TaxID=433720 RepID=A0A818V3X1_9BILA|nr:unnamed protein product [Adineta steineri]CAF3703570.1 unnamed protein product [Adineta steineri]